MKTKENLLIWQQQKNFQSDLNESRHQNRSDLLMLLDISFLTFLVDIGERVTFIELLL